MHPIANLPNKSGVLKKNAIHQYTSERPCTARQKHVHHYLCHISKKDRALWRFVTPSGNKKKNERTWSINNYNLYKIRSETHALALACLDGIPKSWQRTRTELIPVPCIRRWSCLLHSRLYFQFQFQGELTLNKMPAITKINSQKCRASNSWHRTWKQFFFYINGAATYYWTVGSIRLPRRAYTVSTQCSFYGHTQRNVKQGHCSHTHGVRNNVYADGLDLQIL